MDIVQVGVDHHTAPLALRERIAIPTDRQREVVVAFAAEPWLTEVFVVSTCNRTEVYAVTDAPDGTALALAALRRHLPTAPTDDDSLYARRLGESAAVHLFRVACGLESAILGETEIQGQVKEAHRLALEVKAVGPILDRLASSALRTGKRARTETGLGRGAISHGHAAYEAVRRVFGGLEKRTVLVVGAGEMATLAAKSLTALAGGRYVVANRSQEAAAKLAALLPSATAVPLEDAPKHLREAHVALFAGGSDAVSLAAWHEALERRRDPLLVLDFGVPRCVDPAVGRLSGVFLHDLEAIERWVNEALKGRREAIPAVETIVTEELSEFKAWHRTQRAAPAIRSLHTWAETIRAEEAARIPATASPEVRSAVEELSRRIVDRILRRPTARVRKGVEHEDPSLPTPEALENVFGLGDVETPAPPAPRKGSPVDDPSRRPGGSA